jgi:hypothetical protein
MTGGIEKQNYWEHRRCETDIKKYQKGENLSLMLGRTKPGDLVAL